MKNDINSINVRSVISFGVCSCQFSLLAFLQTLKHARRNHLHLASN